jgi:hypothetical protein
MPFGHSLKFTQHYTDHNLIVIIMRYCLLKETAMGIRLNEDYYHLCCDWCDTENRVLWEKLHEGVFCGACHKKLHLGGEIRSQQELHISSGLF